MAKVILLGVLETATDEDDNLWYSRQKSKQHSVGTPISVRLISIR